MINLLSNYSRKKLSKEEFANLASQIEIQKLGEPIGKQDQYPASYGGFNFIKFRKDGSVEVSPINISDELVKKIESRIIIFSLNKTRDVSSVLEEQNKNIKTNVEKFEIMRELKKIAIRMRQELESGNIDNFGEMLNKSWNLKKKMASNISSPYIDDIYSKGISSGAEGGKVLGAGGGGFILFYCQVENQERLKTELSFLKEFKIKFEKNGTHIIQHD